MKMLQKMKNSEIIQNARLNYRLTFTVAIVWLVLVPQFYCTSNLCINYIPDKDYALHGHVLTKFQVTWEWGCVEKCQQDSRCRSFNYQRRSPTGSHFLSCEISWSTREISGSQYRYSPGVTYYAPEIPIHLQDPSTFIECFPGEKRACFKFYLGKKQRKTWHDAKTICDTDGASLMQLQTGTKIEFIRKILIKHSVAFNVWIGLSDLDRDGKFHWMDGSQLSTASTDWAKGQPHDSSKDPLCVSLVNGWNLQWGDGRCKSKFLFICEKTYSP